MSQYEHIDSGLLEQYALGLCTPDEEASVEKLLQESAEARETFDEIQRTLENMAALRAISPPEEMKARIFSEIRDISAAPSGKVVPMKPRSNLLKVAAIVGLLIAIGSIFRLQQLRQETISENERLQNEASELKSNLAELNSELNTVQEKLQFLGETNTKKLKLVGEDVNLEVITYWNDASKKAYVDVSGLPKAPEGKCYQLWADVHGEMLSVGVLAKADDASSFSEVAHYAEAESLNITLEDLPGSDHATVSALVTSTPV